jgi:hypothetical protein
MMYNHRPLKDATSDGLFLVSIVQIDLSIQVLVSDIY